MKKTSRFSWFSVLAAAGLAILFVSCGSGEEEGPGAYATDFETSSSFFSLMSGMKDGNSPHGSVQIWYSDNVKDALGESSFTVPVGTVAIKKFQNGDGSGIVVMIKREAGYDEANQDWYYDMRDASGNIMEDGGSPVSGKIGMCIDCHASASGKDYLAGTGLR